MAHWPSWMACSLITMSNVRTHVQGTVYKLPLLSITKHKCMRHLNKYVLMKRIETFWLPAQFNKQCGCRVQPTWYVPALL